MSIVSGGWIGGFIGGPTCVVKDSVIQQNQMHEERGYISLFKWDFALILYAEVQKRLLLSFDEMHLNTSINVEIKLDIVLGHTGSSLSGDN